eukprot:TRINITY_DN774382_c0_g1_i1.p1 TRINITY_DN774382_c0_g1~~TRINITY_DN774382_c0_g1_i1.p1  ORF type:complete len:234 (-),score=23.29 TRINITY_DN774382_c0_g1_i1:179-880(-)
MSITERYNRLRYEELAEICIDNDIHVDDFKRHTLEMALDKEWNDTISQAVHKLDERYKRNPRPLSMPNIRKITWGKYAGRHWYGDIKFRETRYQKQSPDKNKVIELFKDIYLKHGYKMKDCYIEQEISNRAHEQTAKSNPNPKLLRTTKDIKIDRNDKDMYYFIDDIIDNKVYKKKVSFKDKPRVSAWYQINEYKDGNKDVEEYFAKITKRRQTKPVQKAWNQLHRYKESLKH